MEIKVGTLVTLDMYGREEGRILSPDQKRALGVVVEGPDYDDQGIASFRVRLIYPVGLGPTMFIVGVLEKDLMPLSQTTQTRSENIAKNLPDIIISLAREIDELTKKVVALQPS